MAIDPAGIDWFRDPRLVDDPYPYFNALRDKCPVEPEDHYGVTMVTGWEEAVAGLQRREDVLVLHVGDRSVPRIPGAA